MKTVRLFAILAPLGVFALLAGLFGAQLLSEQDDALPSALLSKPVPEFDLAPLIEGAPNFTHADLAQGEVSVVNLWASWCGPCRVEHPELMALSEMGVARMHALNYKDENIDAARGFLEELGDPFERIGYDVTGRVALRWGVTGVPETFIVDGAGRVVYKHVGPIQNDDLTRKILPAIEAAAQR